MLAVSNCKNNNLKWFSNSNKEVSFQLDVMFELIRYETKRNKTLKTKIKKNCNIVHKNTIHSVLNSKFSYEDHLLYSKEAQKLIDNIVNYIS